MNLINRKREVLTIVIAIDHDFGVRSHQGGFLLEFLLQQVNRLLHRFVEEPIDQTQRKHIPAFEHRFIVHAAFL